jgi:hypothetical protein
MVILHVQLFSFKEGKVVPVQRKFFSEFWKESAIQFQREPSPKLSYIYSGKVALMIDLLSENLTWRFMVRSMRLF